MRFFITLKRLVEFSDLDFDDKKDFPELAERDSMEFEIEAENEESALDTFHFQYAIAVLDDFEITVK